MLHSSQKSIISLQLIIKPYKHFIKSKLNGIWIAQSNNGRPLETTGKTDIKFEDGEVYQSATAADDDIDWRNLERGDLEVKDGNYVTNHRFYFSW